MSTEKYSELVWTKSTLSGPNGNCVEVARAGEEVLVRNSRDPLGPALTLQLDEWMAFLDSIKATKFDCLLLM